VPDAAAAAVPALGGRHLAVGSHGVLRVAALEGGELRESTGDGALARLRSLRHPTAPGLWIDYTGPSPEQVAQLGEVLDLHPLIVEDIVEGNQRSKIEATDGLVHIVMFALEYRDTVVASEIDLVLGRDFLLTVHDEDWNPRQTSHLRAETPAILAHGPDHVLWALSDSIVDNYFPFADRLGDAIDALQDDVIGGAHPAALQRLFQLKRELIEVRRAVAPVREIFNQLANRELGLVDADETIYFRDIYDHLIRLTDELDTYRELVSGTLEVYLSQVNNSLSLIMKRLTGVTVIVAGIGAVAGIFGMSEAGAALSGREADGFWTVVAITVLASAVIALILRRIDWI